MTPRMPFVFDDGGRKLAGFKGDVGDCVVRAVAIATGRPYLEVYEAMATRARTERSRKGRRRHSSARNGVIVQRTWFKRYMASLGCTWVPTMTIGSGCRVHLVPHELPPGRLIVSVSKHMTAVIDGVIRDTHDPQRTKYRINEYGVARAYERCVYGYWHVDNVSR